MTRTRRRTLIASAIATLAGLALALPASAHVSIDTYGDVAQGGFSKLGFSVPNERDDAGTVEVQVQMPQDHPLPFVSVQPKPGWTVATTTRTLDEPVEAFGTSFSEVVDTITWTADEGVRVGPGEFDLFWMSVGPLPSDVESLAFPALQTYDSGEVVRWIEPMGADGSEPEHPAPTVSLVAGSGEDDHHAGDESSSVEVSTPDDPDGSGGSDDSSDTLSIIALIVGGLGLLVGLAALAGRRRSE